jgi:hypothetical protein
MLAPLRGARACFAGSGPEEGAFALSRRRDVPTTILADGDGFRRGARALRIGLLRTLIQQPSRSGVACGPFFGGARAFHDSVIPGGLPLRAGIPRLLAPMATLKDLQERAASLERRFEQLKESL